MFVQVRLLTNVSSPFPEKIVRERLRGIRTLRGAIAAVHALDGGEYRYRSLELTVDSLFLSLYVCNLLIYTTFSF